MAEQENKVEEILIGLTGTHGAGKSTVASLLASRGFKHYPVSEYLSAELKRRGVEANRPNRSDLADEFRRQSPTRLMELTVAEGRKLGPHIIVEPQYTLAEVGYIKDQGGIVIAVDADLQTRYDRISTKRKGPKDQVTFEEFAAKQAEEMASDDPNDQNLAACVEAADHYILNNGSSEDLEKEVNDILDKLGV